MKGLACIWHYPAIGARLVAQGAARSSSAQSAINSSSCPKAAARCTPTGNPRADIPIGKDAAGWPEALKAAQKGE
jgi:hypothetical protein